MGKVHNECIRDEAPKGKAWCSTKVDKDGNHIENEDLWSICGTGCPIQRKNGNCYLYQTLVLNLFLMFYD